MLTTFQPRVCTLSTFEIINWFCNIVKIPLKKCPHSHLIYKWTPLTLLLRALLGAHKASEFQSFCHNGENCLMYSVATQFEFCCVLFCGIWGQHNAHKMCSHPSCPIYTRLNHLKTQFEPLWNFAIQMRQLNGMTHLLESVLSKVTGNFKNAAAFNTHTEGTPEMSPD